MARLGKPIVSENVIIRGLILDSRDLFSKEKYEELLEFFRQNARLVKEDYQETYYFDSEQDLRIQKNNAGGKIWLKKGKLHDDYREEIEIRFAREDFDKVHNLFMTLGYGIDIKWFRKRFEFDWQGVKVCLDYTKGYGYIIELEEMSDELGKEDVLKLLREKLRELGVEETSKEIFNKKFDYYKENWRNLIEDGS